MFKNWFRNNKTNINTNKGDTIKNSTIINNDNQQAIELIIITLQNINKSIEKLDQTIDNNTHAIQENHKMITEHVDNQDIHINKDNNK